ncbi:hypothetical protein SAMN05421681_102519 [Lysobacter enzymogenes]|jgi:hypothetical protein|nr:hypothetical protein SAMN05421681_102519 [Lysobacter enzymogenes]
MPTPAERLETMLADFERDNPIAGANLRTLIETTPELEVRMLTAIGDGNLDTFKPLDPALRASGWIAGFNPKDDSILLPIDLLQGAGADPQKANTLRLALGHEVEHAVNKEEIARNAESTQREITRIAKSPSPHDYTDVLKAYNDTLRPREINDQIAGFNVLAAHVRRENPDATPEELYAKLYASSDQMQPYFDVGLDANGQRTFTPKPGLTLGPNGDIAPTAENIEAMGQHFFDRARYAERYAARNLEMAEKAENQAALADPSRPPMEIKVDLQALGLPGLALPLGFSDSSPSLAPGARSPETAPHSTESATPSLLLDPSRGLPGEPGPSDRAYFQLVRDRLPEQVPDHAVAHAVLQAKRDGLEADQVDPSKIGFSQGRIWIGATTPGFHVSVDPAQAPPMEQVQRELQTPSSAQSQSPAVGSEELQSPGGRSR